MLPVTSAEQTLMKEMEGFRKNAVPAFERIIEGIELAINVLGNINTAELSHVSHELSIAKQLVSNLKIAQDDNSVWISCQLGPKSLCYRDAKSNPVNAKKFMFALMSFEKAFSNAINKINHISNNHLSTLNDMQNVLHQIITNYVEAE